MKGKSRLALKQGLKYFFMIVAGIVAVFAGRLLFNLDQQTQIYGAIIGGSLLVIGFIFDAISVKDALPFIKN